MKKPLPSETLEAERRQLWREVAVAVAAATNATQPEVPGNWADYALAAFDRRFGIQPEKKP